MLFQLCHNVAREETRWTSLLSSKREPYMHPLTPSACCNSKQRGGAGFELLTHHERQFVKAKQTKSKTKKRTVLSVGKEENENTHVLDFICFDEQNDKTTQNKTAATTNCQKRTTKPHPRSDKTKTNTIQSNTAVMKEENKTNARGTSKAKTTQQQKEKRPGERGIKYKK